MANLLSNWGSEGYLHWLSNLRDQYHIRRDWMCNSIAAEFTVESATKLSITGAEGLVVFNKGSTNFTRPLFSFIPPTAGMFIWATFYFRSSRRFLALKAAGEVENPEQVFADQLWASLAKELVGIMLLNAPLIADDI